jgi:coenzyme F420-reducing hydrogenase gamma subunit
MDKKIKMGWFSYSCCEDNTVVMTEVLNDHWRDWKEIFDFRHIRVLKSQNKFDEFDIAFIEGAIASPKQEEEIKEIRNKSKKLVAIGSCAVVGLPAGQRNSFSEEQDGHIAFLLSRFGALPEVKKVSEVVKVDAEIPGCPMSPDLFIKKVNSLISELRPNFSSQNS